MKKKILILLVLILLVGCSNNKNEDRNIDNNNNLSSESNTNLKDNSSNEDKNEVNFYLFYSNTCSYCQDEKAWLSSIQKEHSYLKTHYYEVSENNEIYQKIKSIFNISSNGVPLTIIGNEYYLGFSDSKGRKFERIIKELSEKKSCDVVDAIINNRDYTSCMKINEEL